MYEAPPPPPAPHSAYQAPGTNGFAIASMTLGIVGVILFAFFAIPSVLALIFGLVAIGQINRTGGLQGGRAMAITGIVLGSLEILAFVGFLIAAATTSDMSSVSFHTG